MPRSLKLAMMATLLVTLLAATHAQAEENEGGFRGFFKDALHGKSSSRTILPKYQKECASCHIAYPAGFLPAASWQSLMGSLNKHFGTDASLPIADAREISQWLASHGGTDGGLPAQNRITRSGWFLRKHRAGELPAHVWARPSVHSPSNCAACHQGAERGRFDEDEVRIPG